MRIRWSVTAVSDLEGIATYIARSSTHYASRTVARLIDAAEPLEEFPLMGRRVPEAESDDVRELLVESYRLIYRVSGGRVEIVAVVHGSRDLEGLR